MNILFIASLILIFGLMAYFKFNWLKNLLYISAYITFIFALNYFCSSGHSIKDQKQEKTLSIKEKADLYDEMVLEQEMYDDACRDSINEMGPY